MSVLRGSSNESTALNTGIWHFASPKSGRTLGLAIRVSGREVLIGVVGLKSAVRSMYLLGAFFTGNIGFWSFTTITSVDFFLVPKLKVPPFLRGDFFGISGSTKAFCVGCFCSFYFDWREVLDVAGFGGPFPFI